MSWSERAKRVVKKVIDTLGSTVSIRKRTVGAANQYAQAAMTFADGVSLSAYVGFDMTPEIMAIVGQENQLGAYLIAGRTHLLAAFPASDPEDAIGVADRVDYKERSFRIVSRHDSGGIAGDAEVFVFGLVEMEP